MVLLAIVSADGAAEVTIVEDYSYNPDGALTAITTTIGNGQPTTTYLSWDNFAPDPDDPTSGTVNLGNGRLVGYGPQPGTANLEERFAFDRRDRLTAYQGPGAGAAYDYHADGMLASASTVEDTLRFYYNAGKDAGVTNIHQPGADLWSAYLGGARFLSDGTEEILLKPRKDTAGTYDPEADTLQAYVYDAFGSQADAETQSDYDLVDNPFQYAGEWRDPVWGGYYLRARWYHPDLPVFLSRDPHSNLNRYAYGGGNPYMNIDPGGTSFKHWWHKHIGKGLGKFLGVMNRGVGGDFARIFLAPQLGVLQLVADPAGFWDTMKHDRDGMDVFLVLGIVSEVGGGILDNAYAGSVRQVYRFWARTVSDVAFGTGQSVMAGADKGFKHFNWNAFRQGMEYTAGAVYNRSFSGANVRSGFTLDADGLAAKLNKELTNAPEDTALVFRNNREGRLVTPIQEASHLGFYHERLIAITKDGFVSNDLLQEGLRVREQNYTTFKALIADIKNQKGTFEFVGRVERFDEEGFLDSNPRGFEYEPNSRESWDAAGGRKWSLIRNNCQVHAYSVLQEMGLR